ncbi:MAG: hypothetical protein JNM84_11050 [Planctomycetes bacterium]|nr:hypothetical protein [Planctomycetota bacterium]
MTRPALFAAGLAILCSAQGDLRAQSLSQLLALLESRVLEPGWIGNYVARGVLHDQGWALWEMPESYLDAAGEERNVEGGGYNHALRRLALDSAFYRSLLRPGVAPLLYDPRDFLEAEELGFRRPFSRLDAADWSGIYAAGTSIALQNLVFAPERAANGAWSFWTYPELAGIVRAASAAGIGGLYGNIGFANNRRFYHGEWRYNVEHGQQAASPSPAWQVLFHAPSGVSLHTYVEVRQPWDFSTSRVPRPDYVHAVLDPLDPVVIGDCLASVRHMASTWGREIAFFVGGETELAILEPKSQDLTQPELPPRTGYSPRAMAGFRTWLERRYAGDVQRLNTAWQPTAPFASFQQVTPSAIGVPPRHPSPSVRDFEAYLRELAGELRLLQYTTAKAATPQGRYGTLGFGALELEESSLRSDFAVSGSWYGTEDDYFRALGNELYFEAAAARLSGTPTAFAISSPATHESACTIHTPTPAPFWQRCLTEAHAHLLVHDVLTSGSLHVGYYKAPGGYATYGSSAADELRRAFSDLKARRRDHLRFMTPYHRVHLHVDRQRLASWRGEPALTRLLQHLERHVAPFALFSDTGVFERAFAQHALRRGVLVSVFHRELLRDNAAPFRAMRASAARAPQAATAVLVDLPTAIDLLAAGQLAGMSAVATAGSALVLADPNAAIYLIVFPSETPAAGELEAVLDALLRTTPDEPTQPVELRGGGTNAAAVHANVVHDGLNFFVALANRDPQRTVTGLDLRVHPEIAARFAPAVTHWVPDVAGPYVLAPRATQYVLLRAVLAGSTTAADLRTALAQALLRLQSLQSAGFDVSAGLEQHAHAAAIDASALPSRALAGLLRLRRMVFLAVARTGANARVEASRLDGTPVAGAQVQLVHLSNGREVEDVGRTDGQGVLPLRIGTSAAERWDFFASAYRVPAQSPAVDAIEIHVHDPRTGEQSFVTR